MAVQSQLRQIVFETLSQKSPTQIRAGGVVKMVQHLSSKCEALNSNSSTAKIIKTLTLIYYLIHRSNFIFLF
jgi:hypothetical protein